MRKRTFFKRNIFVFSPGFEERSLGVLRTIRKRYNSFLALQINDFYNEDINIMNELTYQKFYKSKLFKSKIQRVFLSYLDPIESFNRLNSFNFSKYENISVDMTSFTDESLLILLNVLYYKNFKNVEIFYSLPKTYKTNSSGVNSLSLSYGIKDLRNIIGFPGIFNPLWQNHLIIIGGFELDRILYLIEILDYSKVTVLFGKRDGSVSEHLFEVSRQVEEKITYASRYVTIKNITVNNLERCIKDLNQMLKSCINENVTIVPLGSKITTLAAYTVCRKNDRIQLLYTNVENYHKDYSSGLKEIVNIQKFDL